MTSKPEELRAPLRSFRIKCVILSVLIVFCQQVKSAPTQGDSLTREPDLLANLEIDGIAHRLTIGRAHEIPIRGDNTEVVVSVAPTRHFNKLGIEFDYSSSMEFSADINSQVLTWKLKGDNAELRVIRAVKSSELSELATGLEAGLARVPGMEIKFRSGGDDAMLKIPRDELRGCRRVFEVPWCTTRVEWFLLPVDGGEIDHPMAAMRLFIFNGDEAGEEEQVLRRSLAKTLKFSKIENATWKQVGMTLLEFEGERVE